MNMMIQVRPPEIDGSSTDRSATIDLSEHNQHGETAGQRAYRHVLCVYPYHREINDTSFFPPLGLEFIAKAIQPFTKRIDLIDLRKEEGNAVDFLQADTDMVCFSINWNRDGEFLREQIKSIPPGVFVLVGGRHATENPGQWLEELPNVNAVVRGDGEEAVDELCRGIAMEQITGLSFRRDGKIHHNVNRVAGKLSDDIFPDRSLRRHPYEINVAGKSMGLAIDMVSSSRGCPFNCKFCSFSRNPWGTKREWSARSPESVVNEIEQIDARIIGFTDDLFTYDLDRVSRICDLIIERGLNRNKYVINARLEIAKQPWILRKMERAGFAMLMLGIESAHDKTLKSMNKGFTTEKIREYMKVLRRSRMIMHGYFIMGNIGESVEDMLKIPSFARDIGLDTIALSWLRVEPHSGLEELIAANPGYHVGANGKVFSDHCSAKQMRKLRRRLNGEFYSFGQIAKIASKGFSNDALSFVPGLAKTLPAMAVRLVFDKIRRKKRHARKRGGES